MPPRRSESPEGVADLLKQDSFGGFDEEEPMLDGQDADTAANRNPAAGEGNQDLMNRDDQSTSDGPRGPAKANGATSNALSNSSGGGPGRGRGQLVQGPKQTFRGKGPARYFIVKSNNTSNIEHSVKNGIWATQKHNEDKLVDAFRTASHVYLIFSANMSGHFQGYAKMAGLPFRHHPGAWEGSAAVSNSFNVDWIRRYDLPFKETEHLTNPMNEDKPVKISRDGQELPLSLGLQLCRMFDDGADAAGVPKPVPAVRNPNMRAGPPAGGMGGRGMGRGGMNGPMGPRGPGGMVMTPMGPMPAQMAMMGNPMMGMGFGGPGMMDEIAPMVGGPMGMGMGMSGPMGMGMHHPMMGGMMGMGPGMSGRGPVPPPKPPPRSPPRSSRSQDEDFRSMMMKSGMRGGHGYADGPRSREEELMMRALEMTQRGRSPRRERRHRSRSRSASPRRGRSRRHSRSRSRSRSRGRGRDRDDFLNLSYDEYLEAYKALQKAKLEKEVGGLTAERDAPRSSSRESLAGGMGGMNPMKAQMAGMMGGMGAAGMGSSAAALPARGAGGMGGVNPMMAQMGSMMRGQGGAGGNMSEDDYVRVWENYSKMTGRPFDAQTVRGWYRQYKQYGMMNK